MTEKGTARVEAFSDGVFAIAITLLILEIHVPKLPAGATNPVLFQALAELWPSYLSFLLSFVVILMMWINHHELLRLVRRVDNPFLFANGFLLLMVTFVPFPTAVLAQYLGSAAPNAAVVLYCGTFLLISIAYSLLLESVVRNRRLLRPEIDDQDVARIRRAYNLGLAVYSLSVLVAFWSAVGGLLVCSSLWIQWIRLGYTAEREETGHRSS